MTTPAIAVNNVHKTYGAGVTAVTALHDVSLSVPHGEVLLMMGPSDSTRVPPVVTVPVPARKKGVVAKSGR